MFLLVVILVIKWLHFGSLSIVSNRAWQHIWFRSRRWAVYMSIFLLLYVLCQWGNEGMILLARSSDFIKRKPRLKIRQYTIQKNQFRTHVPTEFHKKKDPRSNFCRERECVCIYYTKPRANQINQFFFLKSQIFK